MELVVRTHSPEPLLLRTKGTSWVALPDGGTNRHRAHRAKPNSGIHLRDPRRARLAWAASMPGRADGSARERVRRPRRHCLAILLRQLKLL